MSRATMTRAIALVLLPLLLSACGTAARSAADVGAEAPASPSAEPTQRTASGGAGFPVTVDAANGAVTIDRRPDAIVSLSPTATEMLFAIGAGDQVIAVDDFSNHPPEAPTTDLSGFEPNIEAIAGYGPDLVVIADDGADVAESLDDLDIPVLVAPAASTLDDSYGQIEQFGVATGHQADADALVQRMRSDIDEITTALSGAAEPLTYYHELDDTYFSVTSDTFIGQIYDLVGLRNVADDVPDDAGGYPQLSEEFIIDANPDLIFLADTRCCGQSAETVAERPGWDQIAAVRNSAVIELDDDIASRWGPRIVDLLGTVADAVAAQSGHARS